MTFLWKDYARGNHQCTMTLDGIEFIRRFLLHALPRGFQRIRHFGLLANRARTEKLALCRRLFADARESHIAGSVAESSEHTEETPHDLCPECKLGRMRLVEVIAPGAALDPDNFHPATFDTS